jgi:hypothetical protein
MAARDLLDRVHTLATLDALESEPDAFAAALARELPEAEQLDARDAVLSSALARIDETIARAMRLRMDKVLDADTAIAPPTRRVFATTIVAYAGQLELLGDRVRDVAMRARAADPDGLARAVVDAGHGVLALRDTLRFGVLALVRAGAAQMVAATDARARDRTLDDATRMRASAERRELEALAADPARVAAAPWDARVRSWPDQLDEPAAQAEVTFADMIELD